MEAIRVTLITQPECSLCEDAREVIERVFDAGKDFAEIAYEELSIADHPELAAEHAEYVPVVLVDGKRHSAFKVNEGRLALAIVNARNARLPKKQNWLQRLAARQKSR